MMCVFALFTSINALAERICVLFMTYICLRPIHNSTFHCVFCFCVFFFVISGTLRNGMTKRKKTTTKRPSKYGAFQKSISYICNSNPTICKVVWMSLIHKQTTPWIFYTTWEWYNCISDFDASEFIAFSQHSNSFVSPTCRTLRIFHHTKYKYITMTTSLSNQNWIKMESCRWNLKQTIQTIKLSLSMLHFVRQMKWKEYKRTGLWPGILSKCYLFTVIALRNPFCLNCICFAPYY